MQVFSSPPLDQARDAPHLSDVSSFLLRYAELLSVSICKLVAGGDEIHHRESDPWTNSLTDVGASRHNAIPDESVRYIASRVSFTNKLCSRD